MTKRRIVRDANNQRVHDSMRGLWRDQPGTVHYSRLHGWIVLLDKPHPTPEDTIIALEHFALHDHAQRTVTFPDLVLKEDDPWDRDFSVYATHPLVEERRDVLCTYVYYDFYAVRPGKMMLMHICSPSKGGALCGHIKEDPALPALLELRFALDSNSCRGCVQRFVEMFYERA